MQSADLPSPVTPISTNTSFEQDVYSVTQERGNEQSAKDFLPELARDYSKYPKVDTSQQRQQLEDNIDDMLTRLDEFCGLVDMVRSDDSLCLSRTLPEIYAKSQDLEVLFERVDKLETFINIVKHNLDVMEEKITEAECHIGGSSVKKLLSSLQKPLFTKKTTSAEKKPVKYEPPEIFNTSDFIKSNHSKCPLHDENSEEVIISESASEHEIQS